MSTVVFVGQTITDQRLLKKTTYSYHPDSDMKAEIIRDLEKHLGDIIPEKIIIDLNISISLSEYDTKYHAPDKNQCYQESLNTKTGE